MDIYYLYHHIRLDNNEVFYVGIGKVYSRRRTFRFKSFKSKYSRAHVIKNRNKFWYQIVGKTDYKIEIIFESNDYNFILNKEVEHIKKFGRKDLKTGTLVNFTDGGEGIPNCSDEIRKKLSDSHKNIQVWNKGKKGLQVAWNKGMKMSKEHGIKCTKRAHELNKKKCYVYNLEGEIVIEFNQIRDLISYFKAKNLNYYLDKFKVYDNKFVLSTIKLTKEEIKLKSKIIKGGNFTEIALVDDDKNIIEKFKSISQAVNKYKTSYKSIKNSIDEDKSIKIGKFIAL